MHRGRAEKSIIELNTIKYLINPKEGKKEERWMKQKEMAKRKTMAL